MEEDIKILEEVKRPILATGFERQTKILKAIENLIKGYRELEEEWRINKMEEFKIENECHIKYEDINDYIPKSKIKEKIEELKANIEESKDVLYGAENIVQVLQELMEDK